MLPRARRLLSRLLPAFTRRALLASSLWLATVAAADACRMPPWSEPDVVSESLVSSNEDLAWFSGPTKRYTHGVLGDLLEPTRLHLWTAGMTAQCGLFVDAEEQHVFEDIAPRLVDVNGDGRLELIVVRSHEAKGAQLVIYGVTKGALRPIAKTAYIGTRFRWLAPLGAADLDGDGHIELAYIDRPHLAKTLRIWRFENGNLTPVADHPGLTNHQIGQDFISGGIRTCADQPPEIITANKNWTRLIASTLTAGQIETRDIGPHIGPASFTAALSCH